MSPACLCRSLAAGILFAGAIVGGAAPAAAKDAPLVLDGDELELVSLALDGREHPHEVAAETLTLRGVPDAFVLKTVTRIVPQKNTSSAIRLYCHSRDWNQTLHIRICTVHASQTRSACVVISHSNRISLPRHCYDIPNSIRCKICHLTKPTSSDELISRIHVSDIG